MNFFLSRQTLRIQRRTDNIGGGVRCRPVIICIVSVQKVLHIYIDLYQYKYLFHGKKQMSKSLLDRFMSFRLIHEHYGMLVGCIAVPHSLFVYGTSTQEQIRVKNKYRYTYNGFTRFMIIDVADRHFCINNIAIGDQAAQGGQVNYNVAIGDDVVVGGQIDSNVAIGTDSAYGGQNRNNVAIGGPAAQFQDQYNVAIGNYVGYEQIYRNVAIGVDAVSNGQQVASNVAIGDGTAYNGQDVSAIAIGTNAAYGATGAQGSYSIAIGSDAGADADNVPIYSIQVGYQSNVYSNYDTPTGTQNAGIAIGTNASSYDGALVLNSDLNGLSASGPGLFAQPIRANYQTSNTYLLQYDTNTKEIVYGPQLVSGIASGAGGAASATRSFGVTFASPPIVTATILNPGNTGSGAMFSVTIGSVTTTGFTFYPRYLVNGSPIVAAGEAIAWTAIGQVLYD